MFFLTYLHLYIFFLQCLLLVTTPSSFTTFEWLNCPIVHASFKKFCWSTLVAFAFNLFTATWVNLPWARMVPRHTSANSPKGEIYNINDEKHYIPYVVSFYQPLIYTYMTEAFVWFFVYLMFIQIHILQISTFFLQKKPFEYNREGS